MAHRICFTGRSALTIARGIAQEERRALRRRALPAPVPPKRVLDDLVAEFERANPQIALEKPIELAFDGTAQRRSRPGYAMHFFSGTLSAGSLFGLSGDAVVAVPPLALAHVALDERDDIAVLEYLWEACGTYRTARTGASGETAYQLLPLSSTRQIGRFLSPNSAVAGTRRLARLLKYTRNGSESPRETKLALLLGLPMSLGGYGAGMPQMNFAVSASPEAQSISGRSGFRCDLCWPDAQLDVEYQSFERHSGETSRQRDSRRANALASMGWTVINVTNEELDSYAAMNSIAKAVFKHLGKRQRVRVDRYHARKLTLRRKLGLPVGYE